jgi:hypothetical protein
MPRNYSGSRYLNEADGQHLADYDPATAALLVAEAADIVRAFGFMAQHIVLIGGLVPGLLVPVLDPGLEPHAGTADIDLCLSLALVEGDTGAYERIEEVLKRQHFEEGDVSFRWHRKINTVLTVEFFCPAGEKRPAGRMFRPKAAESPIAKANFGSKLSALALDAGGLLTTDVEVVTRRVTLPGNKGMLDAELLVTGPLAFLAAKADALQLRDKPKDAYDIVWLIESWPGGPAAAAASFARRQAFRAPETAVALRSIADKFSSANTIGSRSYSRFAAAKVSEEAQLERRAVGAVGEFLAAIEGLRE